MPTISFFWGNKLATIHQVFGSFSIFNWMDKTSYSDIWALGSLRDLSVGNVMDTSTHDLTREFFVPMLSNSVRYGRGVGYFSSGWLRMNGRGMVDFANHAVRARSNNQ